MEQTPGTALATRQPAAMGRWRMAPTSLGEAMEMATIISKSELCPKAYAGKPGDCIVAYEYGASLGLSWMQALRSVAVINGIPSIFGDAVPALIYGSGECERFHETYEGAKNTDDYTAVCVMQRKGMPDEVRGTFSIADAKKAKLWDKAGPWQTYPDRMLKFRARGFAARDAFADKLSGLILAEEAGDYIEGTVVSSELVPSGPPQHQILFEKVPEALRDNIGKAFVELKMSTVDPMDTKLWIPTGLGLTKLNEFLAGDGVDPEAGAKQLLEWCKDEYAKRKTGQPRAAKDGNGKKKSDNAPDPKGSAEPAKPAVSDQKTDSGGTGSAEPAKETPKVAAQEEALF